MPVITFDKDGNEIDLTPETYKNEPWAQNIKSADELFNQFANAQSLIGKSVQIPTEEASDEDWSKVFKKLGRPEKPEDYGLSLPDTADETTKTQAAKLAELFHASGLSKKQAAKVLAGTQELTKAQVEAIKATKAAKDAELNETFKKVFGDKEGEAKSITSKLLEEFVPASMKEKIKELPAESLTLLSAALKGITDKYISQDDLRKLSGGASSSGGNAESFREEAIKLMGTEEYKNVMHSKHSATVEKVNQLYMKHTEMANKK